MIQAEVDACLGHSRLNLTLGRVMELAKAKSPFLFGGDVTGEALVAAVQIFPEYKGDDLYADLKNAIQTAWRGWEIVMPSDNIEKPTEKSDVALFSPEWMATVVTCACHAMPSLTYLQVLWEVPLAFLVHLAAAEYRYNGGITRRDHGEREAIRIFLEMKRKRKEKEQNG